MKADSEIASIAELDFSTSDVQPHREAKAIFHYTDEEKITLLGLIHSILNLPSNDCLIIFNDVLDELAYPISKKTESREPTEYRFYALRVAILKHCAEKLGHPNPETIIQDLRCAEEKQIPFSSHISLSREEINELLETNGKNSSLEEVLSKFGSVFVQHLGYANPQLILIAAIKMQKRLAKKKTCSSTFQSTLAELVYKSCLDVLEEKIHIPHPDEGRPIKVSIKRIIEAPISRHERELLLMRLFGAVEGVTLYSAEVASEELEKMMYAKAFWQVREQDIHHDRVVFPAIGKPDERHALSLKAFEACSLTENQRLMMIGRHLQGKTPTQMKNEGNYVKDDYMVARRKIIAQYGDKYRVAKDKQLIAIGPLEGFKHPHVIPRSVLSSVARRLLTADQAQVLEDVHLKGKRIAEMNRSSKKDPSRGYQLYMQACHNLFLLLSSERMLSLPIPGHQTDPLEVSVDDLWDMIPQLECEKSRAILQFVYLEGNKVSDFKPDTTFTRQKSSRLLQRAQLALHKKFSPDYPVEIPVQDETGSPYTVKRGELISLIEEMAELSELQLSILKALYIDEETIVSTRKKCRIWNMKSWRKHFNPALKRLRDLIEQEGLHFELKERQTRQTRISPRNRAISPSH